ncbi:MAG: hypothetical protein ACYC6L_01750 [Anaerolineae bacterium]
MVSNTNPFVVAEQRYRQLLYQLHNGEITQQAFDEAQAACVVTDARGGRWFPAPEQGRWLRWDGQQWAPYVQPASPARLAAQMPAAQPAVKRKKGKGCLIAVLIVLGILLVVAGILLWRSPLAIKWGLRPNPAKTLLGEPNREAALELKLALAQELDTTGTLFYILPNLETHEQLLYIVADASLGFNGVTLAKGSSGDALVDYLVQVSGNPTVAKEGITVMRLDYIDSDSAEVGTVIVHTSDLAAFSRGEFTLKQLMGVMQVRANLGKLVEGAQP